MSGATTKSKLSYLVIGALAVVALLFVFLRPGGKEDHKAPEAPPVKVQVVTLESTQVDQAHVVSGTVTPMVDARIAPKIMGNVAAVYVQEGDRVRRGQVLLRLEAKDLAAQAAQARAGLNASLAGAEQAEDAITLQKAQTRTTIATAEAAVEAARQNLSLVKAGPRDQQKAQAKYAVVQAEARFRNAEADLTRMKRLYEQDVIPKQRLDSYQTAFDVARAESESAKLQASMAQEGSRKQEIRAAEEQVKQAEQALRMAKSSVVRDKISITSAKAAKAQVQQAKAGVQFSQAQLQYATIVSPVNGVISSRMVDPGDTVSPGVPVIAVQSDSIYHMEAMVAASIAGEVSIGDKVPFSLGDKRQVGGVVSVISPAGDPSSRKFLIKVDLPKSTRARSGDYGKLYLPTDSQRGIVIPASAIRTETGTDVVYVADRDNRARMNVVRIGKRLDDSVEVLSGLSAGDQLIVSAQGTLFDGVRIRQGVGR